MNEAALHDEATPRPVDEGERLREALGRRYGSAPLEAGFHVAAANACVEGLLAHRSVRAFRDAPLPEGALEWVVAAAQSAATSSNTQIWSVVAIESAATRHRLAELCGGQAHVAQAPVFLAWVADFTHVAAQAAETGAELEHLRYLDGVMTGATNVALAMQNAVVAAESLGLGTVYIGGLRNDLEAVIRLLDLPALTFPVLGLCVGFEDQARPAQVKLRLPLSFVLHRERYARPAPQPVLAEYETRLAAFFGAQGVPHAPWRRVLVDRLRSITTLHGRERLAAVLRRQGFGLE